MAGTAPTGFQFTKTLDAGPVHCSVWLSRGRTAVQSFFRSVAAGAAVAGSAAGAAAGFAVAGGAFFKYWEIGIA